MARRAPRRAVVLPFEHVAHGGNGNRTMPHLTGAFDEKVQRHERKSRKGPGIEPRAETPARQCHQRARRKSASARATSSDDTDPPSLVELRRASGVHHGRPPAPEHPLRCSIQDRQPQTIKHLVAIGGSADQHRRRARREPEAWRPRSAPPSAQSTASFR